MTLLQYLENLTETRFINLTGETGEAFEEFYTAVHCYGLSALEALPTQAQNELITDFYTRKIAA